MLGTGDIRFFDLPRDPLSVNDGFYTGSPHGSKSSLGSGLWGSSMNGQIGGS
jgi:hypothetical protein